MTLSLELLKRLPLLPLMVYVIDLYDPYGKEHSTRVAVLSVRLACFSGFDDTKDIELSALLHDIGKIGIPEYLRRLPGKYTEAERVLMQQHADLGEQLLRRVQNGSVSENIILSVKHHHEDWNGTGYPDNLKGESIPLGARIIRLADYYDAVTHVRGYALSKTHTEAIQMMKQDQEARKIFDPALFQIFLSDEFWDEHNPKRRCNDE